MLYDDTRSLGKASSARKRGVAIMCIAAWVWQSHPLYPLILLFNRDEYHSRPTIPVAWWEWGGDKRKILGGRDVNAGGTWMGCTEDGRVAFLTNAREPDPPPAAKSRGDLPPMFLESVKSPLEFAEEIGKEADRYKGFNLILADLNLKTMVCISNRPKGESTSIQVVSPGLHVLSNAKLDTPWPKAKCLGKNFLELLDNNGGYEFPAKKMVEKLMGDRVKTSRDMVPNTGCDPEWELELSSIFVEVDTKLGRYGTRSQVALSVKTNGQVNLYERYLDENEWKEHTVEYQMETMKQDNVLSKS